MRFAFLLASLGIFVATSALAQQAGEPLNPQAQKAFAEAQQLEKQRRWQFALDDYRKAAKLDPGCTACLQKTVDLAEVLGDWKAADAASAELGALAKTPEAQAEVHLRRANLFLAMGRHKRKDAFASAQGEADAALAVEPGNRSALFLKGEALAEQGQDEAAKQVFTVLLQKLNPGAVDAERVARYAARPELVRARMAPAFSVLTADGKRVSLDSLQGKVVLLDF